MVAARRAGTDGRGAGRSDRSQQVLVVGLTVRTPHEAVGFAVRKAGSQREVRSEVRSEVKAEGSGDASGKAR
jgi:hypothetical protein